MGHVGLQRDEDTAVASRYYLKLPPMTARTVVLVVDPMLATGGSAITALDLVKAAGARDIRLLSVVCGAGGRGRGRGGASRRLDLHDGDRP